MDKKGPLVVIGGVAVIALVLLVSKVKAKPPAPPEGSLSEGNIYVT